MRRKNFTLLELIVSMAVFSILMLMIMRFFNQVQMAWSSSGQRSRTFEEARTAMDLMKTELKSTIFTSSNYSCPFYFNPTHDYNGTNASAQTFTGTSRIFFCADTPLVDNEYCTGAVGSLGRCYTHEIEYCLDQDDDGVTWLVRRAVPNQWDNGAAAEDNHTAAGGSWDVNNPPGDENDVADPDTANTFFAPKNAYNAFVAHANSNQEHYEKVVPYVVDLEFQALNMDPDPDGNLATNDASWTTQHDYDGDGSFDDIDANDEYTVLPDAIKINLTMLGKDDWTKWALLLANGDSDGAKEYLANHKHNFSSIIYVGDKKRYNTTEAAEN